jgi:hypothetical protein
MADGLTSLSSLNWGTSTGGAASSGESTLTLGVDRSDTRTPPDVFHIWGAQLNAVKNLALAMSLTFKGGTRLGTLTQSSNPFGASESGFYIDTGGIAYSVFNGTPTAIGSGGGAGTLSATYAAGVSTASSIMALDATRGAVVVRDNASTIGAVLQVQNSGGSTSYLAITGNSTQQIKSAQADGAGNVGVRVDTTTTYASGKIFQIMTNASEKWSWQTATMNLPANATLSAASAATNTTSVTITTNVAEGASSAGLRINNAQTLSSGQLLQLANNGTALLTVKPSASDGVRFTGGSAYMVVDSTNGAILGWNSNFVQLGSTFSPGSDLLVSLGAAGQRWNGVYSGGALAAKYNTQSGTTYTVLASDHYVGLTNTAARTVTLPAANAFMAGQMLWIKDEACTAATGNVTTNRAGADTIVTTATGATSLVINTNGGKIGLVSDGVSKWFQVF